MCRCMLCLAVKKHNVLHMSENLEADTPAKRAKARLSVLLVIFVAFLKYVGLFFIGIMVGGGIVLKNPPEDKKALQQIQILTKEKKDLADIVKSRKMITQSATEKVEVPAVVFP